MEKLFYMFSVWIFSLGLILLMVCITHYGILEVMAMLGFTAFMAIIYDKLME